jgi:hypothetical protein
VRYASPCLLAIAVASLAVSASAVERTAADRQREAPPPALPLRMTAFAVNMSNIGSGGTAVVEINITRWTTAEERAKLLSTIVESTPDGIMRALTRLPSHGRMSIPGHRGPDPMKVVLGWVLHYAWYTPLDEGGHRIVLATDRYVTFAEARENPRTMDYPFTLLDLRLGKDGEGVGKASIATKITFDKKKNIMELENYSSEPVRLQQVKIEK